MHDLSLYLLELLENATRAGASVVHTTLRVERPDNLLELTVEDNGTGLTVSPAQAVDPFFTTKSGKRTGLGLSLFKAEAEAAGGGLTIGSSPALGGVRVTVTMRLDNVDRPPTGDLVTTLRVMAVTNPQVDFRVTVQDDEEGVDMQAAYLDDAIAVLQRVTAALDGEAGSPADTRDTARTTRGHLGEEEAETA